MTVKEYLQQIPDEEIRARALKNLDSEKANDQANSLEHAIYWAFRWHRAPEGFSYWKDYHTRLKNPE